jgi:hypothetical protein
MRISATIIQILVLCRELTPLLPLLVLIEFILRSYTPNGMALDLTGSFIARSWSERLVMWRFD